VISDERKPDDDELNARIAQQLPATLGDIKKLRGKRLKGEGPQPAR
jgi:hypothetical protein